MNQPQKPFKILLIGDSCYDYYHYGEVKRISPEAPIPIFDFKYVTKKMGMAANVYENLKALENEVYFHTSFKENKRRYIDIKSKHQLLRVDEKIPQEGFNGIIFDLIDYVKYDAIAISDYGKGFFCREDYKILSENFDGPIFIDTKDKLLSYYDKAIIKVNQYEYESSDLATNPFDQNVIVTYGGEQVIWHRPKPDCSLLVHPPKVDAHDVCGAGDTFFAALIFEYLRSGNDMAAAIQFAMKASAITVQKIGVYAPTLEEIENDKT